MADLGHTIDPYRNTQLRSELAQGASVGDRAYDARGVRYRWSGVSWDKEPRSQQDRVQEPLTWEEQQALIAEKERKAQEAIQKVIDEGIKRAGEFDANNPFSFDEALAMASARQIYSPHYEAELRDFLAGMQAKRADVAGEQRLLTELNTLGQQVEKQQLGTAVERAGTQAEASGTYFSGARGREEGLARLAAQQQARQREEQYKRGLTGVQSSLSQLGTAEAQEQRRLKTEEGTELTSSVEKQRQEALARMGQSKAQYIGYPYITKMKEAGLDDLLKYTFST